MLTPSQTRFLFNQKGWERVVGFHTRNVAHRAHEHIQIEALRITDADGLLISPVIGPRKRGDFQSSAVLASYQACLESGIYPQNHAVLSGFASYPRYAGPREAVFTAICRQNMGCSHFIVGRDHTGVSDYYKPDDSQRLFETIGDIGIVPVFFGVIGYDATRDAYGEDLNGHLAPISGTEVREAFREAAQFQTGWYGNVFKTPFMLNAGPAADICGVIFALSGATRRPAGHHQDKSLALPAARPFAGSVPMDKGHFFKPV